MAIQRAALHGLVSGLVIGMVCAWSDRCAAEVQKGSVPCEASDFAINPETGDLVALDVEREKAVLIRRSLLEAGKPGPSQEVKVGPTPCAICFKQTTDRAYYAVVCTGAAFLYLIDAEKFDLRKKIPIAGEGVSHVTASLNPQDPFLYYNFGSGHGSSAGAVDLRTLVDRGAVFDSAMDSAFSANGLYAYRRGPWSPSGFESLICKSGLEVDKPVFTRLFYDHTSTGPYVPDRHNRFTATGRTLCDVTLEKKVASFQFTPEAFSGARPLIFGIGGEQRGIPRSQPAAKVVLQAASSNTFSNVGHPVSLDIDPPSQDANLPRGVSSSHADFKAVRRRSRLLVDDARSRLVYATGKQVFLIPFQEFELPDEPVMAAKIEGPDELNVGQEYRLKITADDPRVQVEMDNLPDGARFTSGVLTWTPTPEQVGEVQLDCTLKFKDLQSTTRLTRAVIYPSIKLPFAATNMAPLGQASVLVWNRPTPARSGMPEDTSSRLAIVNTKDRKVLAETKVAQPVRSAASTQQFVFLTLGNDQNTVEVRDARTLERVKSLVASNPVTRILTTPEHLVVAEGPMVEVYEQTTWKRVKQFTSFENRSYRQGGEMVCDDRGALVDGILTDFTGSPRLIVSPFQVPVAGTVDYRLVQKYFGIEDRAFGRQQPQPKGIPIPGTGQTISAAITKRHVQVPNSIHTARELNELVLNVSGGETERVVLERRISHQPTEAAQEPGLALHDDSVWILSGDRLFSWKVDRAKDDPMVPELSWNFRQSAFVLDPNSPATLTHEIHGGQKPYKFELLTPLEGFTLNEKTGEIRTDVAQLRPQLEPLLAAPTAVAATRTLLDDSTRLQLLASLKSRFKAEMKGLPAAVPIRLNVTDAQDHSLLVQYLVLIDTPVEPLRERLAQPKPTSNQPTPAQAPSNEPRPEPTLAQLQAELDRANRRIESLENQVEVLMKLMAKPNSR